MTWASVAAGDLAEIFNGKTPSKSEQRESGHAVLKIKDVDGAGAFRGEFSGFVEDAVANKHRKKWIRGGETLVLNAAHNASHVASKTFFASSEVVGALATGEWLMVRWDESQVSPRFGNHWINHPATRFQLRHLVNGIHLYPKDVARLKIPLPPLPEQKRIAKILDAADALRAKRLESLAQLDALLQSTFLEMFGDPRRKGSTGELPCQPQKLGDLARIRTGKLDANAADDDGLYPFFTCAVSTLRINTPAFDTKAVLVAGNGDLNVKYYEGKFNAYQRTYVIESLDEATLHPRFMHIFLDLYVNELRKQAIGGVIKYIKLPYLKDATVQLPDLEAQVQFAKFVESVEEQQALIQSNLTELDSLFASLQSRAFTGQL